MPKRKENLSPNPFLLPLTPFPSPSLPFPSLFQNDPDEGYGSAQGADSVMAHKQRKHDGGRSLGWYRRQEYIILVTGIITMIIGLSLTILASLKISQFNEATAAAAGDNLLGVEYRLLRLRRCCVLGLAGRELLIQTDRRVRKALVR